MKQNNNIITSIQAYVVSDLKSKIQDIDFISENRFDIETVIQTNLKKTGIVAIVMTPTLNYAGITHNRVNAYELPDLTVQIVEYVPINRSNNKDKCYTSQDIGIMVADALTSPKTDNHQDYNLVSITTGEDNGLLVTKVLMNALVTEEIIKPVKGGKFRFVEANVTLDYIESDDQWYAQTIDGRLRRTYILKYDETINKWAYTAFSNVVPARTIYCDQPRTDTTIVFKDEISPTEIIYHTFIHEDV